MFGGNLWVDIPNVFRNFESDPNNPENYDFAFTDLLITALVERGIEPIYRLGVTIENYSNIKAYRIYPPADYKKWAEICEHIIMHYTEGWANGFNYKITYWEIWNEPDNEEEPEKNRMWRGNAEEFYLLYEVASKHLKKRFPHLKIGGYGSCGFYGVTNANKPELANSSSRHEYFITFFLNFLKYIKKNDCPLDFFSWHSYASNIEENIAFTDYVRKKLDENGFENTEHSLNEWSCRPGLNGTVQQAVITTAMMLALQNTSLDSAMFYDARCGMSSFRLFDCMTYEPFPNYYAFVAFGELYKRGKQVYTGDLPKGVYCVAAKDQDGCIVIANTNGSEIEIELDVCGAKNAIEGKIIFEQTIWKKYIWKDYDFFRKRMWKDCGSLNNLNTLPPNSVIMIKYELYLSNDSKKLKGKKI